MKKGSLRDEALFETWIIRILINECRNILRKRKIAPLPLEDAIIAGTGAPMRNAVRFRLHRSYEAGMGSQVKRTD
jgi:DNA-directed RNA polymerase specialized sigma24 family protein